MAERYKFIAMNAPADCQVAMDFSFTYAYPIAEFLHKINLVELFHNVLYWQSAQFKFEVIGVDINNNFQTEHFDLWIVLNNYTLDSLPTAIHDAFENAAKFYFEHELPNVVKMAISFPI